MLNVVQYSGNIRLLTLEKGSNNYSSYTCPNPQQPATAKTTLSTNLLYSVRWHGRNKVFEQVELQGKQFLLMNSMRGGGCRPVGGTEEAPVTKERISESVILCCPFSISSSRVQKLCMICSSTILLLEPVSESIGVNKSKRISLVSNTFSVATRSFQIALG